MRKVIRISLIVIIIGVFIATIFFLYQKSKKEPVVYETKTPFVTNIIKKTVATGSVVPRKEIEIKPQVSGIVEAIYIQPGDVVKNGDLIAKVRIIPNMINLNNAEARLESAKINFDDAKMVYDRQKKIFDEGVIPAAEFQQYEISLNRAKSELNAAENNLQLIKEGVTKDSKNTTNTLIRSTIEGMVLDVPVEQGNSVIESNTFNAGTTIAIVANMGEMVFEGKVDETEVGKIKTGMNLLLTIGAIEETQFNALLEYISPKGVEENGAIQFEIKAAVKLKEDYFIRASYSANADIVLDRRDSVLAVEESLLTFKNDSVFVEIETAPQVFEKRKVDVGLSDGINIEILSGLTKTDKIKIPK
ncbi:MAG: efflux transporter periplasmic adaptor subunit [Bacteroidetes bacterium GWC2_33_15]|nr:MAG: efflux transporter periplasmic adaptor subunit [Bacteroidetes bacterium GWA2_33_15]OFX50416.1 MAG: efflux transporter periplasmic adaptor subunit [Bacteroidetes bacterium GWC2_33_15]OFX66666.1 MAG: efflux transporter periplasmic adaptor subunit [Bacteroidetes bacterium GWB2_32_14]OFX69284.1 MAG: efflux transporter periplasmic adaptor subunit [Bacteroidetes bacterium GWD2_33_33]HAN18599.1 efflux transporter periplasmic adaptor subunit [Bacteroidales bacterium]